MREILFRGKRTDNGEWVNGYYVYDCAHNAHFIFKNQLVCPNCINDRRIDYSLCDYEIDPETLCQYTELKDKNGNRIWENDIVRIENSMDEGIGNIEFYGGIWYVDGEPSNSLYDIVEYDDADIEVIGNIFDNPEMMKGTITMTENEVLIKTPEEAIETIKSNMPTSGYQMLRESLDMAIKALEEIQQYREIGTVEEVKNQKENLSVVYRIINDYRSIGTVEECRKAVGDQSTIDLAGYVKLVVESNKMAVSALYDVLRAYPIKG